MEKVVLIGLGAMGSYFAGNLTNLLGDNFVVVAQGKRKERLQKGMTINGIHYNFRIEEPSYKGFKADLVIVAVKMPQLDTALDEIANFVDEKTQIMTVLNGVESEERAISKYGKQRVIYSYMRVGNQVINGCANFNAETGRCYLGEGQNQVLSNRIKAINNLFDRANIKYINDEDMIKSIWHKFMCNIGENLSLALFDLPFGALRVSEHLEYIRQALMLEVIAIANAKGIALTRQDMLDQREKYFKRYGTKGIPSTLQDLRNKKPTEIDMFAGSVVRFGRELNIPTPINEFIYHAIKVKEEINKDIFIF